MNKKILLTLILGIFMFSLVSSISIGSYKIDETMQITNYCQVGTCTYMNLTSLTLPNGTLINPNAIMTKNIQDFNYSYIPDQLGEYTFVTCGNPSGVVCDRDTFLVTQTGKQINQPEAILYFVIIIGLIIFFIVTVYGAITLPYKNSRNEDGKIIGINDKKYLKILSIFSAYGVLTWLANIMISISNNYIDIGITLKFFTIMFKLLISLLYPTLIFTIILIAIQFSKDLKIGKLLERGL